MIILSHTNLSGINLGGINLSEIKLGMPSGKGSGGEETFDPASFDQAWTVTGKTNDDEDRATVKNLTGNGNDLVLSNFAFAEDSGYGNYPFSPSASLSEGQPYGTLHFKTDGSYSNLVKSNVTSIRIKFNLRDMPEGGVLSVRALDIDTALVIKGESYTTDGSYEFIYDDPAKPTNIVFYNGTSSTGRFNFYVDIIPDYEGYLVTDGVDDKIQSSSFELDKDWTIIGDWMLFETPKYIAAGIIKAPSLYLYNSSSGLQFFINTSQLPFNVNDIKSVNAICSDGRIYTNDWNEVIGEYGNVTSSNSPLLIGFNSNNQNFIKTAFKNLSIYNGKVLTKDQCIKAYNYLQTLKEK